MTLAGDGDTYAAIFDHVNRQWQRILNVFITRRLGDMNSSAGITDIDCPIRLDGQRVGVIEAVALVTGGQHGACTVLLQANDLAIALRAQHDASLWIQRYPVGTDVVNIQGRPVLRRCHAPLVSNVGQVAGKAGLGQKDG